MKKTASTQLAVVPTRKIVRIPEPVVPGKTGTKTNTMKGTSPKVVGKADTVKGTPKAKPPKITFQAPADVTSAFMEITFNTKADGFIGSEKLNVEIIKGGWDNPKAKRYDLIELNPTTAMSIVSRLAMLTYITNPTKRFTPNTVYKVLARVTVSRADGSIRGGVKKVWRLPRKKNAELTEITDKKDSELRRLRRAGKFLAGGLTELLPFNELKELAKK